MSEVHTEEAEAWLPGLTLAGRDCDWVCGGEQAAETEVASMAGRKSTCITFLSTTSRRQGFFIK